MGQRLAGVRGRLLVHQLAAQALVFFLVATSWRHPSPSQCSPSDQLAAGGSGDGEECVSDIKSEITYKSSEDPDSGDEIPPPHADAPIHDIRCGLLVGKLHMQMFTCPGIHRRCIEYEGKLISPRQFTIKAEKDKQKDWKGSIRLGRYNLRTLMELKTIDFFEHASNCSLKCQSRNYIKNRKSEVDLQTLSFLESISDSHTPNTDCYDGTFCDEMGNESASISRKGSSALEDYVTQTMPSINGNAALACIGLNDLKMNFSCQATQSSHVINSLPSTKPTPPPPTPLHPWIWAMMQL
uniref:SAND domain-containing protein n=1 Tax=Ditylenchus dipsaci TaxID=166011 RepID=A0A915CNF5_9BILA